MIGVLIYVLVVGLIVGLIYWVVDQFPVPQPLNRIIKVGSMVVGCILVILALLSLIGYDTGIPLGLRRMP